MRRCASVFFRSLPLVVAVMVVGVANPAQPATAASADVLAWQDDVGDVSYSPAHMGARDRHHLDIMGGGWFEANESDSLTLKIFFVDSSILEQPLSDWSLRLNVNETVYIEDEPQGRLRFEVFREPGETTYTARVFFDRSGFVAVPRPLNHSFTATHAAPGTYSWSFDRNSLLSLGDSLGNTKVVMSEFYGPFGIPGAQRNFDEAAGKVVYVPVSKSSVNSSAPTMEPTGRHEPSATTGRGSPAPDLAVLVASVALGLAWSWARQKGALGPPM